MSGLWRRRSCGYPLVYTKDKKRTLQNNLCGDEYAVFLIIKFFNIWVEKRNWKIYPSLKIMPNSRFKSRFLMKPHVYGGFNELYRYNIVPE